MKRNADEAAERLQRVTDMVPGVVYEYRLYPDGRSCFQYASSGLIDMFEVSPEEVREDASPAFARVHPDDLQATRETILKSARDNSLFHWEFRVTLPRQGLRWRVCDARPERLPDGSTLWYGVIMDNTERKQAEERLGRMSERVSLATRASGMGVWDWDIVANKILWDDRMYALYGVRQGEFGGAYEAWLNGVHPEDRPHCEEAIRKALGGEKDYDIEFRVRRPDGTVRNIAAVADTFRDAGGRPVRMVGVNYDITDRKRAEEALRESEEAVRRKLQALLAPEGAEKELELGDVFDIPALQALLDDFSRITNITIGLFDLKGTPLLVSGWQDICLKYHRACPETARNCVESDVELSKGVPAGQIKSYRCKNGMRDMVTPLMIGGRHLGNLFMGQFIYEDEEADPEAFRAQARRHGFDEEAYLAAYRRVPRIGRERVETIISFCRQFAEMVSNLSYGKIKLAAALAESRRAHAQIQEEKTRANKYLEVAGVTLVALRPDQTISLINRKGCEMLGYKQEELVGRNWFDLAIPVEQRAGMRGMFDKMIGGAPELAARYENDVVTRGGERRTVSWNNTLLRGHDGAVEGLLSSGEDVTERKLAEARLTRLTDQVPGVVYEYRLYPDGRSCFPYSSVGMNDIYEVTPEEVREDATPVFGRVHPDDLKRVSDAIFESARTLQDFNCELRMVLPRQGLRWRVSYARPERLPDGGTLWYGIIRDITESKLAELALQESAAKLRLTVSEAPVGVVAVGFDKRFMECNKAFCDFLGYTPEELNGKPVAEVTFRGDEALGFSDVPGLLSGKLKNSRVEKRYVRKDGSVVWGELNVGVLRDQAGQPLYFLGIIQDITARRLAEAARFELMDILARSLNEIYLFDAETLKFGYANSGALRNIGYTLDELKGMTAVDIKPLMTEAGFRALVDPLLRGEKEKLVFETEHRRKDGSRYPVEVHLQEASGSGRRRFLAMIQDITVRKRAQLELEKLNRELTVKKEEMENFLYIATHDLRSPLVNIQGFSQNQRRYLGELNQLIKDAALPAADKARALELAGQSMPEAMAFVSDSAQKMDRLITALLKVARLGRLELQPGAVEMNALMKGVCSSLEYRLGALGGAVAAETLPACLADAEVVSQVFTNLIDNALKYRHPDRKPEVKVSGEVTGAGTALYTVKDNGAGIRAGDIDKIWEIFYRADVSGENGEGIGLAMAKRMVEMSGGRIRVESREGEGSAFFVELPAAGDN